MGILVESYDVPAWLYHSIRQVIESSYADVVLVVSTKGNKRETTTIGSTISLLYAVWCKAEEMLFPYKPNAFEPKNLKELLKYTNSIAIHWKAQEGSICPNNSEIQDIGKYELDILFSTGCVPVSKDLLAIPRYGVWIYQHSDTRINRGGPPGFWEVVLNLPSTGTTLTMLRAQGDDDTALVRSHTRTERLFIHWNTNKCCWKAVSFLPRTIKRLYDVGEEEFFFGLRKGTQHPGFNSGRPYRTPGNLQFVVLTLRNCLKYVVSKIMSLPYYQQWVLSFRIDPGHAYSTELSRFNEISPPKDRFWADPFSVYWNGLYYVFFEEYLYKQRKGHISFITIDKKGKCSRATKVLELPYHLSYPFVFMHKGECYMIPESSSHRTIDLYKSLSFPVKWTKVMTLMEGFNALDTTLVQKDGMWWMFFNSWESDGAPVDDELYLFYASELMTSDWTPHPLNPIVTDVRAARPAGKIFTHKGKLYRPAQNCSKRYGYGIAINQIVTLTTTEYEESCVNEIGPNWRKDVMATHTLNFQDGITVIDVLKRRRRVWD